MGMMVDDRECNIISPESLLPETARYPGGPFHLTDHFAPRPARYRRREAPHKKKSYAPTIAEARSEIAAATRSAIRLPVKPTSSCNRAGLPCVT
jgi:hypothetical protein